MVLRPATKLLFHGMTRRAESLTRPRNKFFSAVMTSVEFWQGLGDKRCRSKTTFAKPDEDLVAIKFDELGGDECVGEFLGQQLRIGLTDPKGDHCAGVAKDSLPDFVGKLIEVLVRQS